MAKGKLYCNVRLKLWAYVLLSPVWELQAMFGQKIQVPTWAIKIKGPYSDVG